MKRAILCLILALLLCFPGFAESSDTDARYTWDQLKAKKAGQTLVPTEGQKSVKRGTYQSDVTTSFPFKLESVSMQTQWLNAAKNWWSVVQLWFSTVWRWLLDFLDTLIVVFVSVPIIIVALPSAIMLAIGFSYIWWQLLKAPFVGVRSLYRHILAHRNSSVQAHTTISKPDISQHPAQHLPSSANLDPAPCHSSDRNKPLSSADFTVVFASPGDLYYHKSVCTNLSNNGVILDMPLYKAIRMGYKPCPNCCLVSSTFVAEDPSVCTAPVSTPPDSPSESHLPVVVHPSSVPSRTFGYHEARTIVRMYDLDPSADIYKITMFGTKYHRAGCYMLEKNFAYTYDVNLDVAIKEGYAPCKVCCRGMPEPDIERQSFYKP